MPEHSMRCGVLLECLGEMEPEEILELLSVVVQGVAVRKKACISIFGVVCDVILKAQQQGGFYELLAEVYRLAREQNEDRVADMLVTAQPQKGPVRASEAPGDHELSELTLGERKFMARCHDRDRLGRLLFDPDPAVVRKLLRNPHITERDVIRLCARRPSMVESLKEIYHSKWCERYRIRLSLVFNPYTPADLSIKLVCTLLKKDLKAVCRDEGIHPLVRRQAERLLESKYTQ